jgi:flagellar FliL protein
MQAFRHRHLMANTLSPSQTGGTPSKRGRLLLIGGGVLVVALGVGGFVLGNIIGGSRQPAAPAARWCRRRSSCRWMRSP